MFKSKSLISIMSALLMLGVVASASAATISVTNTSDADPGSLRAAITQANASLGVQDTIEFNIPSTDPNCTAVDAQSNHVCTIQPATMLPAITDSVIMNASIAETRNLPGNPSLRPGIELDMSAVPPKVNFGLPFFANGLYLKGPGASHSEIRGFVINGTHVFVTQDACFSTFFNPDLSAPPPPADPVPELEYCGNGVYLFGVDHAVVAGNYFMLDKEGQSATGPSMMGVSVIDGNYNRIGGHLANDRNVSISGISSFGFSLEQIEVNLQGWNNVAFGTPKTSNHNQIVGNYLGKAADGTPLYPESGGIKVWGNTLPDGAFSGDGFPGNYGWGVQCTQANVPSDPGYCELTGTVIEGNQHAFASSPAIYTVGYNKDTRISNNLLEINPDFGAFAGIFITNSLTYRGYGAIEPAAPIDMVINHNQIFMEAAFGGDIGIRFNTGGFEASGSALVENNLITGAWFAGVYLRDNSSFFAGLPAQNITIIKNQMYNNNTYYTFDPEDPFTFGGIGLVDITAPFSLGYVPNDDKDPDTGPNNLQNHPVWHATNPVTESGHVLSMHGSLNSEPGKQYRLDFYASATTEENLKVNTETGVEERIRKDTPLRHLASEGSMHVGFCITDPTDETPGNVGNVDFNCTMNDSEVFAQTLPEQQPQRVYFTSTATELLDAGGDCSGGANDSNGNGVWDCGSTSQFSSATEVSVILLQGAMSVLE